MDQNMQGEVGLGYGHVGFGGAGATIPISMKDRTMAPVDLPGAWIKGAPPGPRGAGQLSSNPKDAIGRTKTPLHLIPGPALIEMAKVMSLGAKKYGAYNWRDSSVASTVYISAAQRHLLAFLDGEDGDYESGVSHLAHAAACCAILLDAYASGNLVEDRPTPAYGTPRRALNGAPTPPFCEAVKAGEALIDAAENRVLMGALPPDPPEPPREFLWYLATPYSRTSDKDHAAEFAVDALAQLLRRRVRVFCPIAHSHEAGNDLPQGHNFWMDVDRPFMDRCDGLLVLRQPGWEDSRGIAEEIATFRRACKPVIYKDDPNLAHSTFNAIWACGQWDGISADLAAIERGEG